MTTGQASAPGELNAPILSDQTRNCRFIRLAFWFMFAAFAVNQVTHGLKTLTPFEPFPFDGAFQLYNPMRRIAAGEVIGRDFQVFHGLGIPLIHYPLFRILGSDILASEISREMVTRFATMGVFLLVSRLLCGRAVLGMLWAVGLFYFCHYLSSPMNSLLGLRSILPLLLIALIHADFRRGWKVPSIALTLTGAFLLGFEQGVSLIVASIAALVILRALRWSQPASEQWKSLLGGVGLSFILLPLSVITICGGVSGAAIAMRFFFSEVVRDQMWYYCVHPHYVDASNWFRPHLLYYGTLLVIVAGIVTTVVGFRRSGNPASRSFFAACLVGLIYAGLSTSSYLGMSHTFYLLPAQRVLIVLGTAALFNSGPVRRWPARMQQWKFARAAAIAAIALSVVGGARIAWKVRQMPRVEVSEKGNLSIKIASAAIDSVRDPAEPPVIWSTFAGLLESRYGIYHPDQDYILHVLGPERRKAYMEHFRALKPQFVQTARRKTYEYEEWVENTSWVFYQEVLDNYHVIAQGQYFNVWARNAGDWRSTADRTPDFIREVGRGEMEIEIPAAKGPTRPMVCVVRVHYKSTNSLSRVPIVGNMARYMAFPQGAMTTLAISLAPYWNQMDFPVVPQAGKGFNLNFRIVGVAPAAELRIESVEARYMEVPPENAPFLEGVDQVWIDGLPQH